MDWDPEIDTPATIAIVGAGPVGVEAALYARFLGYFVMLFDTRRVGHRPLACGDQLLDQPWSEVASPLGLAALAAQGTGKDLPASDARVSYRQYVEEYLIPVARTDLLYESVQVNSPVTSISRTCCAPDQTVSLDRRAEQEFRLLIDSRQRGEYTQLADIVLDCSGLSRLPGSASGGGLAIGERANLHEMLLGRVDVLGKQRERLAGKHALIYGRDWAACANALDIVRLSQVAEGTRATWIVPKQLSDQDPLSLPADTPAEFVTAAQRLVANEESDSPIGCIAAWGIEAVQFDAAGGWRARLQVEEEGTLDVQGDALINCRNVARDWNIVDALPLACEVAADGSTGEPHYYVLGHKAVGPEADFAVPDAFEQIKRVFARIGGRADLDLYDTVRRHAES